MDSEPTKPFPKPPDDGLVGEYYAWHSKSELRVQKCRDCQRWMHPPRYLCSSCGQATLAWTKTRGVGTVYSWSRTHQPLHPFFADMVPYINIIAELDEGPRILGTLNDGDKDVAIGDRVRATYIEVVPGFTTVAFERG